MRGSDVDVVVVGAGMAGLYALHHLRELGFTAVVLEAGGGVGGTWYWNRYPGARCDVPSLEYSYGFSEELQQEWEWTEVFPAQAELERYFNHVADRFDLRRDIRLNTRVTAATFDEDTATWAVDTEHGERFTGQFLVMATGPLSMPNVPDVPGRDDFQGRVLQTSRWPEGELDLAGKRIGLIGTGSSGVQTTPGARGDRRPSLRVPAHADVHVAVAQRPARRRRAGDVEARATPRCGAGSGSRSAGSPDRPGAIILAAARASTTILETTEAERLAMLEERGFDASRAWSDVATNPEANELAAELYREMVRRTVHDPERRRVAVAARATRSGASGR